MENTVFKQALHFQKTIYCIRS